MTKRKKQITPELIEWDDSNSPADGGWLDKGSVIRGVHGGTVCRSVGVPIKETKKYITLAAHFAGKDVSGAMCIPKSAILKRKMLK